MTLKRLPLNFKPFTTVITQKKKTLTFSEFKVCLRSYDETERMCYSPDESNKFQMKTTFVKINPRDNPGVSMHSHYDYKSTNYNYNCQRPQRSGVDYKIFPPGKTNIICYFVGGGDTKHLTVEIEVIFVLIRGSLNKFPDFFHMGIFIDTTHMKL